MSSEKRTRSQLSLPDDILILPERSPMKDARIALRNYTTNVRPEGSAESDDELLLSPGKDSQSRTSSVHKRSASPPLRDEYASRPDSPSNGRALKRIKREAVTTSEIRPTSTHSRSASQPNLGNTSYAKSGVSQRLASPLITSPLPSKDRAHSVPIFSPSFPAPHIDLRNPPPSPRRARSRSPSKEIKLRIMSGPTPAKLETIPDDLTPDMHTDDLTLASLAGTTQLLPTLSDYARRDANQETPSDRRTTTSGYSARPPIPTVHEPPSTPTTTQQPSLISPLSPLTPLPPTPLPSTHIAISNDRHMAMERKNGGEEDHNGNAIVISSQEFKPLPGLGTNWKSRLPRPSITNITPVPNTRRPSPTSTPNPKATTLMGSPSAFPAGEQPSSFGTIKRLPITEKHTPKPTVVNAFAVLMEQAHKGKGTDHRKGRVKGKASTTKGEPSSSSIATSVPKGKSKVPEGDKREMVQPKVSIKAKMRPKERIRQKPKPIFAPVDTADDDDSPPPRTLSPRNVPKPDMSTAATEGVSMQTACAPDGDAHISPSGMHSPAFASHLEHPPPQTGVPTEVEAPQPQLNVAHVSGPSEPLVPPAIEQSTGSELQLTPPSYPVQSEALPVQSEAASADVNLPGRRLEEPSVSPQPASRTPANMLPLVKKVGPKTATDRITRRMSQRQREKQAEVPSRALHKPSSIHRNTIRKKLLPSDPKTMTLSVLAQERSYDPNSSMSSLSSVPTDPVLEEPVPPGSPMKLSSPVRKVSKVPGSAITSPTRSSTAKAILPKTPLNAKFPPRAASPSQRSLVRSTSMISTRPPGGLARTLTGVSSSSLSTLANALEKLRMPPPERPNTSMGFNRESDADRDFEAVKYGTDDFSIGGLVSESTERGGIVGVGSAESDVRGFGEVHSQEASTKPSHFERKSSGLFNEERVGTTKLYSGSGLIMRGGKPTSWLQHRPRIFGVGTFGSGRVPKVSRKTSLPSVMASPIKGNGTADVVEEAEAYADESAVPITAEKGHPARKSPSRRVSLASQALSQSLGSLPPKQTKVMGPPATPPNRRPGLRSSSSSYPSSTSSAFRQVTSNTTTVRSAPSAFGKVKGGVGGHVSGKPAEHTTTASSVVSESLKILDDCVIFVDVRTDDGDDAGSLFVEMLEGVGAKILTRAGQTCTHIVYKNGLMSTLTRYRLLRDPKPLVVGIAWVVECVEQRKRVDESQFIVNLDGINVAGTNKRRRSMLPKLIRQEAQGMSSSNLNSTECDQSMDGPSSITMDEELIPLELARRRRTGLRTP